MTALLEPPSTPPSGSAAADPAREQDPSANPRTHGSSRTSGSAQAATSRLSGRGTPPNRTRDHRWSDPGTWAVAIGVITLGLWVLTGGLSGLFGGGVGTAVAISRAAGLVAALAALFGLVLTARPRWLERRAGLDRLIGWHRITGITAATGMAVHVATALIAASGGSLVGLWNGLVDYATRTEWYVAAIAAAMLFAIVSVGSWRRIRARMSYETWHMIHLSGYLAVALGFPHQLFSGSTFTGSEAARWWWIGLYLATAVIILDSRLGGIVRSATRPRTVIARIIPEGPDVASLVITGPGVDTLRARPGQFVCLRVLTRDLWWQAHPYSLSAAPHPGAMRLTVKALGDASRRTLSVPAGTRVLLEGPYGTMTVDHAAGRPVLLVGAGVGLAPMRALLEACTPANRPVVLARAHSDADLPLAAELAELAQQRDGLLIPVTGPRTRFPDGNPFTAEALARNLPDLSGRVAYVCGPAALQERVCRELERAGVPRADIHSERFAW